MNDLFGKGVGWIFINEQTSPEEQIVQNLKVHDKNNIFYVEFDTFLHSFNVLNRNNRQYLSDNIMSRIDNSEKIQWFLKHSGWFGEMNHPISYYMDKKLSPERMLDIKMDNTSHKIINPHLTSGNRLLKATLQSDSGCEAGMNLAKKMLQGLIPGFSCRATGKMELINGKPTVVVSIVITYDWVFYPSHKEAVQIAPGTEKFVSKTSKKEIWLNESTSIETELPSYTCDLKDMLSNISHTDDNVRMILESFELDYDSVFDFTESGDQVMIKDRNNIIYANIDYKAKNKINDFMRSI